MEVPHDLASFAQKRTTASSRNIGKTSEVVNTLQLQFVQDV